MARSRHKSTPTCLLAGDRAYVAASLYETDLELCTAPALASRLILDGGSGRNRGQGVAPVVTGPETVVADGLVARAAFDHRIPARLNRAAVGAGLEPRLAGLPVVAGRDAGAAHRGTIDRKTVIGSQDNGSGKEDDAGCRKKKWCAWFPVPARSVGRSGNDSVAFAFCRGAPLRLR